MTQGINIT